MISENLYGRHSYAGIGEEKGGELKNFEDVSTFVSIVFFTLLNISYLLYTDISASQWVP